MPSQIDPTRFAGGQPVSKAELRAALSSARAELEHGGYFKAPAADAVERKVGDKLGEWLSVKDFGAKGDGATDDTAAVQAAMAASRSIYMPPGTYLIHGGLLVTDHAIHGAGPHQTVLLFAEVPGYAVTLGNNYEQSKYFRGLMDLTIRSDGTSNNGLKIRHLFQNDGGISRVHIENFTSAASIALQLTNVQDIAIDQVKIVNCATGIVLTPDEAPSYNTNLVIRDLVLQNLSGFGIVDNGRSDNILFSGGVCQGASGKGLSANDATQIQFHNYYFESASAQHEEVIISRSRVSFLNCHFSTIGADIICDNASRVTMVSTYLAPKQSYSRGGRLHLRGGSYGILIDTSPDVVVDAGSRVDLVGFDQAWNPVAGAGAIVFSGQGPTGVLEPIPARVANAYTDAASANGTLAASDNGNRGVAGIWLVTGARYDSGSGKVAVGVWILSLVRDFVPPYWRATFQAVDREGLAPPGITVQNSAPDQFLASFTIDGPGALLNATRIGGPSAAVGAANLLIA